MPELQAEHQKLIDEHNRTRLRQKQTPEPEISEEARKLLDLLSMHPCVPMARLIAKLGKVSASVRTAMRKELEGKKLIHSVEARLGSTNYWLAEPTEAGFALINKPVTKNRGRGDLEHRSYAHWIAWAGERRGFTAYLERLAPGTNHPLDVIWETPDGLVGFEVAVSTESNILSHIRAALIESDALTSLTIVAPKKTDLNRIRRNVKRDESVASVLGRVSWEVVETYLREGVSE